jgi:pyrroline-5-carboxylate reductase
MGLPENIARSLVMQTSIGASILGNNQPDVSLSSMIGDVCVPGGSTEKGIRILIDSGLQDAVTNAISTSIQANHAMKGDN